MIMGLVDTDTLDYGQSAENSSVQCSICLEAVIDDGQRSWAKLRCGHQFHLDCIGSAFNVKNAMECPNCRETERGQWLYASHPFQNPRMDDWPHDEDFFDHGYSELIGVQWCPMGGLAHLHSSFNERIEFSPGTYHDVIGPHFLYSEHGAVSSATHPYIAYVGPLHPSSSNPGRSNVPDTVGFIGHWSGGPPVHSEVPTSYAFPTVGTHYQNWEHLSSLFPNSSSSSHIGGVPDQSSIASLPQRAARTNQDLQRPSSYLNPLLAHHSSSARAAAPGSSSMTSSVIPPYRSSVARTQDRVQALQAYYQPSSSSSSQNVHAASAIPGIPRSSSNQMGSSTLGVPMTTAAAAPPPSSSDQTAGFYYFPPGGNFQAPADNHQSALPPPLALGGEVSEREVRWAPVNFVNWPVTGAPSSYDFHEKPGSS